MTSMDARKNAIFLFKSSPKYQNAQIKLISCTKTNSNMQNSVVVYSFSIFDPNTLFG